MSPEDVQNDLSFMYGLRRRIKLQGNGPRGIAVVGDKVYAAEYFTDSLAIAELDTDTFTKASSVALGPKIELTEIRKGKKNFNDADMCFQKWQSCASCHPGDGRNDALNWDLLNDGIGNPKNTKSLLLAHVTPPAMITGIRESAEVAVRAGMRHIQFAVYEEENVAAIDEYLKSLKPLPSPYLVRGKLSRAAQRGKKVFEDAGCSSCHSGKLLTDMQKYDVGTGKGREQGLEFDTPTLVEIWRSAPYLNDGRAATIEEVITKFNPDDKHGITSNLTTKQKNDLAQFVLSQ
jgi:cytochrome c peroxidase